MTSSSKMILTTFAGMVTTVVAETDPKETGAIIGIATPLVLATAVCIYSGVRYFQRRCRRPTPPQNQYAPTGNADIYLDVIPSGPR